MQKPVYSVTEKMLDLIFSITKKLDEIDIKHQKNLSPELLLKSRVKNIRATLEIDENRLSETQICDLLENIKIVASKKEILEARNSAQVYENLNKFNPSKIKDLKKVHSIFMNGLSDNAGRLRYINTASLKTSKAQTIAPNATRVNDLTKNLFNYLKKDKDILLIKSCVFHYELELIYPFLEGNRKVCTLWQSLILMQQHPVFEFLSLEFLLKEREDEYYNKISESEKKGNSSGFIEFMLGLISNALDAFLLSNHKTLTTQDRVQVFAEKIGKNKFSRKDYLLHFKSISAPTASRDLRWAVEQDILSKFGEQRVTEYLFL